MLFLCREDKRVNFREKTAMRSFWLHSPFNGMDNDTSHCMQLSGT